MSKQKESKPKDKYKILNWAEYNKSLKSRGQITVWFSEDAIEEWYYEGPREQGGKIKYSELAIETCLTLRQVYHLGLRQTEGFVSSLAEIMEVKIESPEYTTMSRRAGGLSININLLHQGGDIDIIVDSTGLKVYGEGEWKVRKYGWSKHRTWRKLHIGIDGITQEIISAELTENNTSDGEVAKDLIEEPIGKIKSFTGDGAYDKKNVRQDLTTEKITQIIPPQENAVKSKDPMLGERNTAIKRIEQVGRKKWKEEVSYHRRSLVETAMFRYKTIFGDKVKSRKFKNERTEVRLNCSILNAMTFLGMPISKKVS